LIPVGQPLTTAIADTLGEVGKGLIKGESGWKIAENTGIAAKTTWEKNGGKIAEQFTVAPKNVLKDAEKDLAKQANWGNEVPKVKGEQLIKLRDAIKPLYTKLNSDKGLAEEKLRRCSIDLVTAQNSLETKDQSRLETAQVAAQGAANALTAAQMEVDQIKADMVTLSGDDPGAMLGVYARYSDFKADGLTIGAFHAMAKKGLDDEEKELNKKVVTGKDNKTKATVEAWGKLATEAGDIVKSIHQMVAPEASQAAIDAELKVLQDGPFKEEYGDLKKRWTR
jgi:hypothetical protein